MLLITNKTIHSRFKTFAVKIVKFYKSRILEPLAFASIVKTRKKAEITTCDLCSKKSSMRKVINGKWKY
jgi:hypothetical protein